MGKSPFCRLEFTSGLLTNKKQRAHNWNEQVNQTKRLHVFLSTQAKYFKRANKTTERHVNCEIVFLWLVTPLSNCVMAVSKKLPSPVSPTWPTLSRALLDSLPLPHIDFMNYLGSDGIRKGLWEKLFIVPWLWHFGDGLSSIPRTKVSSWR